MASFSPFVGIRFAFFLFHIRIARGFPFSPARWQPLVILVPSGNARRGAFPARWRHVLPERVALLSSVAGRIFPFWRCAGRSLLSCLGGTRQAFGSGLCIYITLFLPWRSPHSRSPISAFFLRRPMCCRLFCVFRAG